jgi:hypothetical protein
MLRLPDFIGVGPPRTGTTWLDSILRDRIGLPQLIKETQFFGWRYELGLEWYARHFRGCRQRVVGEFCPTYFFGKMARDRIAQHLPHCKIVITLREPVDRVYSQYKLMRRIGIARGAFAQELVSSPYLFPHLTYSPHIRAWKTLFGEDRTLVLIQEDSRVDRQRYIDRLCDFIGTQRFNADTLAKAGRDVAHFERAPRFRKLARRARRLQYYLEEKSLLRTRAVLLPGLEWCMTGGDPYPPLDPELKRQLRRECASDIAELEDLIERDLSIWRR